MNLTLTGLPNTPIVQVIVGSIVVISLLLVFLWGLNRLSRRTASRGDRRIQVLEAHTLGPKQKLLLIRLDEQEVLVGISASGISALAASGGASSSKSASVDILADQPGWQLRREPAWDPKAG